jgi:hypothetical protein
MQKVTSGSVLTLKKPKNRYNSAEIGPCAEHKKNSQIHMRDMRDCMARACVLYLSRCVCAQNSYFFTIKSAIFAIKYTMYEI